MKWMIASDLHGSAFYTKQLMEAFESEKADRLLLLGDILNHGPRNGLPVGYDPMAVAEMLNRHKNEILCVHGNCDSEIDQVVLEFPITAECVILAIGKKMIFATHGHLFNTQNPPPLHEGDILLHGHTHFRAYEKQDSYLYCNPGSVTFPKDGNRGYMILENDRLFWKALDGTETIELPVD